MKFLWYYHGTTKPWGVGHIPNGSFAQTTCEPNECIQAHSFWLGAEADPAANPLPSYDPDALLFEIRMAAQPSIKRFQLWELTYNRLVATYPYPDDISLIRARVGNDWFNQSVIDQFILEDAARAC